MKKRQTQHGSPRLLHHPRDIRQIRPVKALPEAVCTGEDHAEQEIERTRRSLYALPPRLPLTVALALDFSFEMTTDSLEYFRQRVEAERSCATGSRLGACIR